MHVKDMLVVLIDETRADESMRTYCVVRDKTRVCLDIVGWTPRASVLKEAQVFLAHFYTVTTVTKTDTNTFSRFLVLNASCVCVALFY